MRKDALFLLLIYAAAVPCANYLILSLPLSVTSKVLCLIWFWSGCLSVALLVILESLGTWSTTRKRDGWNRLATLAKKEREIQAGQNKTDSQIFDEWQELNEREQAYYATRNTKSSRHRDIADYKNFLEDV